MLTQSSIPAVSGRCKPASLLCEALLAALSSPCDVEVISQQLCFLCWPSYAVMQGSAVRQQPCANDLFIPQHMPFDLASSQGRLGSQYALLQSNHSFEDLSNSTHALPQKAWSETQSRSESGAVARHPFSLLPAAAFEHLSDPTSLNACHGSIHSQPSNCASTDVPAQQAVGLTAWHTDENAIQSRLEAMQEKPVWEPVDPGHQCSHVCLQPGLCCNTLCGLSQSSKSSQRFSTHADVHPH